MTPVLHLQGAGKPEHGAADWRLSSDILDLSDDVSDSSDNPSEGDREEKEDCEVFRVLCPCALSGHITAISASRVSHITYTRQHSRRRYSRLWRWYVLCISQSVHQTESLDSNVPVMRLRGGAQRINSFGIITGMSVMMRIRMLRIR